MESGKISLKKTEFSPETGGDSVFVAFIRAYIRTVCREKPSAKKIFYPPAQRMRAIAEATETLYVEESGGTTGKTDKEKQAGK